MMATALVSKVYKLRFRSVNSDIFNAIKAGRKPVETRAATVRYKNIKAGDTLIFRCGKNTFKKQAKKVRIFKTIDTMLKKYKVKEINPTLTTAHELKTRYYSFPKYREKIRKHGLIAIELK